MRGRGVAAAARRRRDAAAAVERGGGAFCGSAARAAADDARERSSPRRAPTRGGANRCRVHRAASREVFHATAGDGRREPAPPRTACTAARTAGGRRDVFVEYAARPRREPRGRHDGLLRRLALDSEQHPQRRRRGPAGRLRRPRVPDRLPLRRRAGLGRGGPPDLLDPCAGRHALAPRRARLQLDAPVRHGGTSAARRRAICERFQRENPSSS